MKFHKLILSILLVMSALGLSIFTPSQAEARWRHFYGGAYWHHGYWYHGVYGARAGWWWVVGPTWYYYPAPVYPYPAIDVEPTYIVQGGSAPAPTSLPPAPTPPQNSAPINSNSNSSSPIQAFPGSASASAPNGGGRGKAFSYYCDRTKAYYPTVSTCADGWIATPVQGPN